MFLQDGSTEASTEAAWTLRQRAADVNWPRLFHVWRTDRVPRHRAWACELAGMFGGVKELPHLRALADDVDGPALAHRLLCHFGSIERIVTVDAATLAEVRGIGARKAARIRELVGNPSPAGSATAQRA